MSIYSIGNFKIYQKHRHKRNNYSLVICIVCYTALILFLKGLWDLIIHRNNCNYHTLNNHDKSVPLIYLITPTYSRPNQIPELIRLRQALQNTPRIHWIIIEDSTIKTDVLKTFINSCEGFLEGFTHLNVPTPIEQKVNVANPKVHWKHHRGILQRNAGLAWLRSNNYYTAHNNYGNRKNKNVASLNYYQDHTVNNFKNDQSAQNKAVIYFMDDDNTYDERIFEEIRKTQKISVWPVGLVGGLMVEKPLVSAKTRKVTGFLSLWNAEDRLFPFDMAAFALNIDLIMQNPTIVFNESSGIGLVESDFLTALGLTINDLEPRADYCSRVLVWHTKSWPAKLNQEEKLRAQGKRSDEGLILI